MDPAVDEDQLLGLSGSGLSPRLAGNPRFAELLSGIISSVPPGLQVHEIGSWLAAGPASEVHQRLVRMFVDHLPAEYQRVAEGVAALGIPVRTEAVIGALEPYVPASRIEPVLRALVAAGPTRRTALARRSV